MPLRSSAPARVTRVYLGTHQTGWLGQLDVPLFVSRQRLAVRRRLPRACAPWALDSGGFTELSLHGRWTVPARQYVDEVRRFRDDIGGLDFASIQDWMCEPWITAKTGLSVAEHQARTVASFLRLRDAAPDLPWIPVLQGWTRGDYLDCVELYARCGVDLVAERVVGIGSVCRRHDTTRAGMLIAELAEGGLALHGFGFKSDGLEAVAGILRSSDSLAWSYNARRNPPLPGCTHDRCNNCRRWARRWLARLHDRFEPGTVEPLAA